MIACAAGLFERSLIVTAIAFTTAGLSTVCVFFQALMAAIVVWFAASYARMFAASLSQSGSVSRANRPRVSDAILAAYSSLEVTPPAAAVAARAGLFGTGMTVAASAAGTGTRRPFENVHGSRALMMRWIAWGVRVSRWTSQIPRVPSLLPVVMRVPSGLNRISKR